MKIPKVDKFVFCLSLEIGGYVVGGLGIITSIAFISVLSPYLTRFLIFYGSMDQSDRDALRNALTMLLLYYGITITYFAILLVASLFVILGTILKRPKFLVPHQIAIVVFIVCLFLTLFQFPLIAIVPVMLCSILGIYFFITLQSLYSCLKCKAETNVISQNGH